MNRSQLTFAGAAFWLLLVVVLGVGWSTGPDRSLSNLASATSHCLFDRATEISMLDPSNGLRVDDPVFQSDSIGHWRQVGSVRSTDPQTGRVTLAWYGDGPTDNLAFESHFQTGRLDEVIATMLPPERRQQIAQKLSALIELHGQEMASLMMPMFKQSLRDSLPVIQTAMEQSLVRHRDQIDDLAQQWNDEIIRQQLVPLARQEVLPIVRKHAEPVVEEVGRELWDKASLWRFGWRAVYDKSPLPQQDLVQNEWDRFVEQQAVPILEAHTDQFVNAVQKTMLDIAQNPQVRSELRAVASQIASDPKSKQLLTSILRETLIENESLKDVWQSVWTSPEAKQATRRLGDRIEPVLREIGDELFGTPETGIDANFARVLRNQILGKDRRFIVAIDRTRHAADESEFVIQQSMQIMPYPVVYLANPQTMESR
jgi:hypothetical protein